MEPLAAYEFMGLNPDSTDVAALTARFKQMRNDPSYKDTPNKERLNDAYRALRVHASALSTASVGALEKKMSGAELNGDERELILLVNGQGGQEINRGSIALHDGLPPPSDILDGWLFLGGDQQAQDTSMLLHLGVRHILNMADDLPSHIEPLQAAWDGVASGTQCLYLHCPARDERGYNISQHLNAAFEFLDQCQHIGGGVLVHCRQGINRSGFVTIAYIMQHKISDFPSALRWVRQRRSMVLTNGSFALQLARRGAIPFSGAAADILEQHFFNPFVS